MEVLSGDFVELGTLQKKKKKNPTNKTNTLKRWIINFNGEGRDDRIFQVATFNVKQLAFYINNSDLIQSSARQRSVKS